MQTHDNLYILDVSTIVNSRSIKGAKLAARSVYYHWVPDPNAYETKVRFYGQPFSLQILMRQRAFLSRGHPLEGHVKSAVDFGPLIALILF